MTPLQTLQAAMMRDPHDLSVWLAIADALEEQGKASQAEHTRLWLAEVAPEFRLPTNPERRRELERQRVTLPLPEHTNSIGMKLAWIPPGKFLMGNSRELDPNAYSEELGQYAYDEEDEDMPRRRVGWGREGLGRAVGAGRARGWAGAGRVGGGCEYLRVTTTRFKEIAE